MNVQIEESWKEQLQGEFEKPYFSQLVEMVRREYQQTTCYPPGRFIFNAFNLCPFNKVKVVIIGQDPYHEPGQAHGLSFSVNYGVMFPPSRQNIFKEKPPVFTEAEKIAWLDKNTDVALGSDAFFPFFDNIDRAKKSGVSYIAEPGGSIRDEEVIARCDEYNMVMSFTGIRLFHH